MECTLSLVGSFRSKKQIANPITPYLMSEDVSFAATDWGSEF